jgi:hypothetical protein
MYEVAMFGLCRMAVFMPFLVGVCMCVLCLRVSMFCIIWCIFVMLWCDCVWVIMLGVL